MKGGIDGQSQFALFCRQKITSSLFIKKIAPLDCKNENREMNCTLNEFSLHMSMSQTRLGENGYYYFSQGIKPISAVCIIFPCKLKNPIVTKLVNTVQLLLIYNAKIG